MSKKSVEHLFEALYRLTDLRKIFRETSPNHELSGEQMEILEKRLKKIRKNLDGIEKEMLK